MGGRPSERWGDRVCFLFKDVTERPTDRSTTTTATPFIELFACNLDDGAEEDKLEISLVVRRSRRRKSFSHKSSLFRDDSISIAFRFAASKNFLNGSRRPWSKPVCVLAVRLSARWRPAGISDLNFQFAKFILARLSRRSPLPSNLGVQWRRRASFHPCR